MTNYILVHGAWHGGWCWKKVKNRLENGGNNKVLTPDLPSHKGGLRGLLPWTTSLSSYIKSISKLLEKADEPVVLVGHSMGGMVITGAADNFPEKIKKLTYICAFVPRSGESLGDIAPEVSPILPTDQKVNLLRGGVGMKKERLNDIFYNQCSAEDRAFATERLCLQPVRAFQEKLNWRDSHFGSVAKMAIICENDKAITAAGQRKMAEQAGIKEQITLNSDHSPFFSHDEQLAEILLNC